MQNAASTPLRWPSALMLDADQTAHIREAYARKRSAEDVRKRCIALGRIIQTDIIPRLMLLHRDFGSQTINPSLKPDAELVAAFTDLVLADEISPVFDAFTALVSKGYALDCLFLDLLAPSAALLGRMWDEDLCDFIEVTIGVARLQVVLATFRRDEPVLSIDEQRRVLLMGAPGEQHTLGIAIVEQFMRRAGWQVSSGLAIDPQQIADLVAGEWFEVVGLTLSCETRINQLAEAISLVRLYSVNKTVGIMVGGPTFLQHPEFVERVGADASAVDAPTAVLLAQRLLDLAIAGHKKPGTAT